MGRVEIRSYGEFQELFGGRTTFQDLTVPCSLENGIDQLDGLVQGKLKPLIYDPAGNVDLWVRILLNGREIAFLKGDDRILRENDIFLFIPVLGGG